MLVLAKRLRELLSARNMSMADFAEMCDLPFETVKNIYYGRTEDPKVSTLLKMADALDTNVNCLMGRCPHSTEERKLIHNYRACGKHGKSIIELIAQYEASAKDRREGVTHEIPCIVPHGEIYNGIVYDMCETEYIMTTVEAAYTAIRMVINDLAPLYCKNDVLLFDKRFPMNGEIAAFYKDGLVYIRKYLEEDGHYRLKCLHGRGKDIIVRRMDEIAYIGTCIDIIRS